jgi:hypothetical protein
LNFLSLALRSFLAINLLIPRNMTPNLISSSFFTVWLAVNISRFNILENEMRSYEAIFKDTFDLISDVDSMRNRLSDSFNDETRGRTDRALMNTKAALKNAKEVVNWENKVGHGVQVTIKKLEWILVQNKAARVHMDRLELCHHDLLAISTELAMTEKLLRPLEIYFEEVQVATLTALARRVKRITGIYSGVERQPPKLRLLEHGQQGVYLASYDFCVRMQSLTTT